MTKFKVGDRISVIKETSVGNIPVGHILIVRSVEYSEKWTFSTHQDESPFDTLWFWRYEDDKYFELVEEEKCEEKPNLECVDLYDTPKKYLSMEQFYREYSGLRFTGVVIDEMCNYKPINKKETFMNKVTSFVKNLTLSADEKLLRKHGLHDENGNTTPVAKDAIEENFFNSPENQVFLLTIAQGLEAEAQTK